MGKITKISVQKNTERLNIYLDGLFAFGVKQELIQDYDLHVGKELTKNEVARITKADELKKCLDKAYRYLSYRPRSEAEVRTKLSEKYGQETVEKAIGKLKKLHYVDDVAFVRFWIEARGQTRGPALIKNELRQKGISDGIIRETLEEPGLEKLTDDALSLIKSKRKYHALSEEEAFNKVAPFLARRGYSYEVIKTVIKNYKAQ